MTAEEIMFVPCSHAMSVEGVCWKCCERMVKTALAEGARDMRKRAAKASEDAQIIVFTGDDGLPRVNGTATRISIATVIRALPLTEEGK